MTDPIGGGIGKASQQMMQELQKQMSQAQESIGKPGGGGQFGDMMAQQGQGAHDVNKVQDVNKIGDPNKAVDVLKTAQVNGIDAARLNVKPVEGANSPLGPGLKSLLSQVSEGQNKLDSIIKLATSGKKFGNQELLAVQASVYKFSQELELTSKVVEKATSGVKQTMQTQV